LFHFVSATRWVVLPSFSVSLNQLLTILLSLATTDRSLVRLLISLLLVLPLLLRSDFVSASLSLSLSSFRISVLLRQMPNEPPDGRQQSRLCGISSSFLLSRSSFSFVFSRLLIMM
jgi:hypothetical protein